MALDLLGELLHHVDLTSASLALLESVHDLLGPLAALAARCALTAGLVVVELAQTSDGAYDVSRLVHDDDSGGTETGLRVLERVKVHELLVADLSWQNWSRRSTWDDGEEVVPTATDATAVLLDQLLQRDRHLFLNCAWVVDVSGDTEELGTRVALATELVEPVGTTTDDGWCDGDGLDVGDCRWATEKTNGSWEWWLQTRLAWLTLKRLDEGGLLTTDVGTHTTVNVDVKVVSRSAGVLSDQTVLVGLLNGALKDGSLVVELTTNVDVSSCAVHGTTSDQAAFDQSVWILAHDFTVLASTWLTLIGIDDQVSWLGVLVPVLEVHERPFHSRWETGTTTSAKSRSLDFGDDLSYVSKLTFPKYSIVCPYPVVTLENNLLGLVPCSTLLCALQIRTMSAVKVLEDAILVS